MATAEEILSAYEYSFPPELIAQFPARPRDTARLLVYDRATGIAAHDSFRNLFRYIPKGSLLVMNETRVIPARLALKRPSGGEVRVLYLERGKRDIRVLADRKLRQGEVLRLQKTSIHAGKKIDIAFKVTGQDGKEWLLRPIFPMAAIEDVFEHFGSAPIPPYIKHSPLSRARLKAEYQTVFARNYGSVAAPTASLHFTKRLMAKLEKQGIEIRFVTLHVGLGTFAPLRDKELKSGKLHKETYEIPERTAVAIRKAQKEGRRILAVGTTVVRTLESFGRNGKRRGATDLFIRAGYDFRYVNGLITNFHVPRSSLMMLVASLTGREKLLALYKEAIAERYRLFSFGDGMLII